MKRESSIVSVNRESSIVSVNRESSIVNTTPYNESIRIEQGPVPIDLNIPIAVCGIHD